ncbi:MAG TPA: PEP/pyruvate-binding domain-containing protein, partial [Ktedonobacterales bacterium]|nr:PEP/pyruvate-binding domain-containing protein [Ktedonobacterales bacterium]
MTAATSATRPTSPLICSLRTDGDAPLSLVGGKGANLVRLVRAGFPVPDGFVITTAAYHAFLMSSGIGEADADPAQLQTQITAAPISANLSAQIVAAYHQLGAPAVAVRSSGTAEDLATASFAGQHDTFLDVAGAEALLSAVRACWASLWAPRAIAYRREHGWGDGDDRSEHDRDLALAVVVQRMVPADAAGVAFTANPLTGDRAETIISAVRGLGERLVSGEGTTDEWVVRGEQATCRHAAENALNTAQAVAVSRLARRIADAFGSPQDIEWAFRGSELFVLQARPMTALPDPISWRSPTKGGWMRNFRLGEWLPEPVTPLFESWLLHRIEVAEVAAEARDFGLRIRPPYHVIVNGWYFSSVQGGGIGPRTVATALLRHPRQIAAFVLSVLRPELGERWLLLPHIEAWRTRLLPDYQRLVASWQDRVEAAPPEELLRLVDEVATTAGEYLWSFSLIGGHAWKVERVLAHFYRKHLLTQVGRSYQELLRGLVPPALEAAPHAVQSLDWLHPTAGDHAHHSDHAATARDEVAQAAAARHWHLQEERRTAERACRQALASQPQLLRRFKTLLTLAQRYAVIREEQAGWFTLGWPVMRRAVVRLGSELCRRGGIAQADDIFFLTHAEVTASFATHSSLRPDHGDHGDLHTRVTARQQDWQRQRRLTPPLALGKPVGAQLIAGAVEAMRVRSGPHGRVGSGAVSTADTEHIIGMPASPGRATGPVRIVRGPEDFDQFQAGEVL